MLKPTEEALLVAIRAGDASSRLVYADLLEEQGHLLRAVLLRDPRALDAVVADLATWAAEICGFTYFAAAPGRSFLTLSAQQDILPGQDATISYRIQRQPFRPSQLLVPDGVALHFEIGDLKLGNYSQLEHPAPIPCTFLTAAATAVHNGLFRFGIVEIGMDVAVVVKNTGVVPRRFTCLMFGTAPIETDWYIGTAVV